MIREFPHTLQADIETMKDILINPSMINEAIFNVYKSIKMQLANTVDSTIIAKVSIQNIKEKLSKELQKLPMAAREAALQKIALTGVGIKLVLSAEEATAASRAIERLQKHGELINTEDNTANILDGTFVERAIETVSENIGKASETVGYSFYSAAELGIAASIMLLIAFWRSEKDGFADKTATIVIGGLVMIGTAFITQNVHITAASGVTAAGVVNAFKFLKSNCS